MTDVVKIVETVAKVLITVVEVAPTVIKTIEDAKPFAKAIVDTVRGKEPTQEELSELEARINDLSRQLQVPLPPEEE